MKIYLKNNRRLETFDNEINPKTFAYRVLVRFMIENIGILS